MKQYFCDTEKIKTEYKQTVYFFNEYVRHHK